MSEGKKPDRDMILLYKIDRIFMKIFRGVSYLSALLVFIVAVAVTANVIYAKLTHNSIPSVNDWVTYLLVPIVFFGAGYMMLDRGLIEVDFISRHFPRAVRDALSVLSSAIGIFISVIIIRHQWTLMLNYISLNKMSSVSRLHFPLWPFPLIIILGMIMISAAFLWQTIRMLAGIRSEESGDGGDDS